MSNPKAVVRAFLGEAHRKDRLGTFLPLAAAPVNYHCHQERFTDDVIRLNGMATTKRMADSKTVSISQVGRAPNRFTISLRFLTA